MSAFGFVCLGIAAVAFAIALVTHLLLQRSKRTRFVDLEFTIPPEDPSGVIIYGPKRPLEPCGSAGAHFDQD